VAVVADEAILFDEFDDGDTERKDISAMRDTS
jgi:hypothetical protein